MTESERSGNPPPTTRQDDQFPDEYLNNDEIDLYDLWNTLVARWYLILGCLILAAAGGIFFGLSQEPAYEYRTSLNVGSINVSGTEETFVEPPSETRERLLGSVIPAARAEMAQKKDQVPSVDIDGGEESPLILMASQGSVDDRGTIESLHSAIADRLKEAHRQVIDARRDELEIRLSNARDELEYLKNESVRAVRREKHVQAISDAEDRIADLKEKLETEKAELDSKISNEKRRIETLQSTRRVLLAKQERFDKRKEVLVQRAEEARDLVGRLQEAHWQTMQASTDSPAVMMLVRGTELSQAREQVRRIENDLYFELPENRDQIADDLERNQARQAEARQNIETLRLERDTAEGEFSRKIEAQKRKIDRRQSELSKLDVDFGQDVRSQEREIQSLRNQLQGIESTQTDFVALRSLQPAGASMKLILVLSILLGGMLGIFLVFFVTFIEGARSRKRESA